MASPATFAAIGNRLRAHRLGRGLTPEALADRLGISRAALYRAEKGEIAKIDMLNAIATELGMSLPSLLGVGIEYVSSALTFFERMRQTEEASDRIVGVFSPISYLVTTDEYDRALHTVLRESVPPEGEPEVVQILEVLARRKEQYQRRRPLLASIVSDADLMQFLSQGMKGRENLSAEVKAERRRSARKEVEHIARMLKEPQIGVQIGIAREPIPTTSFQLMRYRGETVLAVSPFRLGHNPNTRIGVGFFTSAPEAIELHERISRTLWDSALKGDAAAAHVRALMDSVSDA